MLSVRDDQRGLSVAQHGSRESLSVHLNLLDTKSIRSVITDRDTETN